LLRAFCFCDSVRVELLAFVARKYGSQYRREAEHLWRQYVIDRDREEQQRLWNPHPRRRARRGVIAPDP
jgi:hypothetical protein